MTLSPYDLGGVRTLAEMCGLKLGAKPTADEIQQKLFATWGTERAFIENAPKLAAALKVEGSQVSDQTHDALLATETLDAIPLRNSRAAEAPQGPVFVIYRGAVINWMVRSVSEGERNIKAGLQAAGTVLVASNRVCDKDSEIGNRFVMKFQDEHGRYPTEAEILPVVVKELSGATRPVEFVADTQLDQIRQLITKHPELAHGRIYVPTNANATYVPFQIRRAIREQYSMFDQNGDEFWFSQDGFPLARTAEQAADTANYQRPLTVFSGLVRLINELFLLQTP